MKLFLHLQFLGQSSFLLHVWWISWSVFVHASDVPPSLEGGLANSSSELNNTQPFLTGVEHLSDTTSEIVVTVLGANATVDLRGSQPSTAVTSKKPRPDKGVGEGATTESIPFVDTTSEEDHIVVVTTQAKIVETIKKDLERKNVTTAIVHYEEETSTKSSADESNVTRFQSEQVDETGTTVEDVSKSRSQRETSVEELTKEVTSATSESRENNEQTSLLHSQGTPLPLLSSSVASEDKIGSVNDVLLVASSETELELTWKIVGIASYSRVSLGDKLLNLSNRSHVFRSLIPGQTYTASVAACDKQHHCSNPRNYTNNTYPMLPTFVNLMEVGTDLIELQWYQSGVASNFTVRVANTTDQYLLWSSYEQWNSTVIHFNISHLPPIDFRNNITIEVCSGELCRNGGNITFQRGPMIPTNISSINATNASVTLQWFQVGIATNLSVTVLELGDGIEEPKTWNDTFEADGNIWNSKWVSVIIPDLPTAGVNYSSTIEACIWDHCRNASYKFQTAPSDPDQIEVCNVSTESANVSWVQNGVADNFSISVSDQSANKRWEFVQQTRKNVWAFIDQLSTPGQLLTVTVTAFSGHLSSNGEKITFNTKPSKPGSLSVYECYDENLCTKWNQSGIFDSYVIRLNGSEANFSCSKSSDATNNSTATVECILHHYFSPGSKIMLSVAVKSGNQKSDEVTEDYVKSPDMPQNLSVVTASTSMVCFSWNQTGFYDGFDFRVFHHNYSFEENFNISTNSTERLERCINDLPCPGTEYSLQVAAVSHGKKSNFRNLSFHSALDSVAVCGNQTNDSFKLSIRPDFKNKSCPNIEDSIRFNFTYQPMTDESCSKQLGKYSVFNESNVEEGVYVFSENNITDVTGLIAGVTYQVKVWAVVGNVNSEKEVIQCTTEPNSPTGLQVLEVSETDVKFNWTSPEGCVADFLVQCNGQQDTKNDSRNVTENNGMCDNLTPGALYSVTVRSQQRDKTTVLQSNYEAVSFVTVPMPPSSVTVVRNRVDSVQLTVEYNYSMWDCTHFCFKVNGINSETKSCRSETYHITSLTSNTWHKISVSTISNYYGKFLGSRISANSTVVSVWTVPQAVSELHVPSRTTASLRLQWSQPDINVSGISGYHLMLQKTSGYQQNITLNCSLPVLNCTHQPKFYEIKNLTPSTNYTITIWAFNLGGVSDEQMITEQTEDLPADTLPLLLAGFITIILLIIILAALILFLLFRRKTKFAVPSSKRPSDAMGFPNPSFTLGMESAEICERMKPQPILLDKFIEHLEDLHEDSDFRFSSEYALLTELSPKHSQTAAELEENRTKNRYSNILPFDHSRVKLIPLDDDDQGSDYINASYMPGYVSKREFIAAQGPMKSTVDDFWRMIWEQHISTIVMVTNLQERGREKCADYWPTDEEPIFYGDLQVQLKSESQLNYYIIRILDVKLGEKKRVVKHLHFVAWPDFGCPENTTVLLDFVLGVRAHTCSQPSQGSGPILVHCSAGVGRTGTFIIVDHLLQHMRTHKTMDIFGLVLNMRNFRCNMIQTEAQYIFAHECIKTAIERQMISSARNSNAEDDDDECVYQNVGKKEKPKEDDECLYQNFSKNNMHSVQL